MYLDPVPIPGKVRSVIVIRRIDAIHDILAELGAAGWFWNAGQYPTQYDPLTNCEAERRDQVSCVILDCFKRIITTTCYSEEETDHVLSEYRALHGMIYAGEKAALSLLEAIKDRTEIINYAANERISGLLSWYNNEFQKGDATMVLDFTADEARENVARYEEMAAQNRRVLAEEFVRTEVVPAIRQKSLNGVSALLSKYCIPHEAFELVKNILETAGYVVESNTFTREYRVSWEPVEEPEPEPDPDGEGDG